MFGSLEQSIYNCLPAQRGRLIHHSGRGSQDIAVEYTQRPAEAKARYHVMLVVTLVAA